MFKGKICDVQTNYLNINKYTFSTKREEPQRPSDFKSQLLIQNKIKIPAIISLTSCDLQLCKTTNR